ncbi:MFTC-like protein [Mya arenaria]|uniref:MFTC-like protein n=1 Tax=Mya arenaria TaxID=6604 RepID=A0ABY7F3V5_MYAAR|nr:MFTC-like protein [Mya arenaria]WAR16063.1 MFTC-like protein [Mya arenaria]
MTTELHEGMHGFYKGLVPGLLRVTPACCITFVVYESMITSLMHSDNNNNSSTDIKDVGAEQTQGVGHEMTRMDSLKTKLREVENIGEIDEETNLEESVVGEGVKT